MLYYLFEYLNQLDIPGAGVFKYISFRAASALILSLIISMIFGKRIIRMLHKKQVGESIRDLGLEGQLEKKGTPTMGGLIILAAIIIPSLLFAKLNNIYIILMIVSTIMLGLIGFVDDYIKVFKKNKDGLAGKFKVAGQFSVGLFAAITLYFHPDVVVKKKMYSETAPAHVTIEIENDVEKKKVEHYNWEEIKSTVTTIPFFKNNEFDYSKLLSFIGEKAVSYSWFIFIPIVIFIVTAVSNGANITDGIDGLATGTSAIIGAVLAVFAYVSGNTIFADYLNIMYIPNTGELVIFISAFVGACVGFLWYNSYPAQVFMGDTGSLALGGIIAVFSLAVRKELLIPVFCGIFLIENLSVMMQVSYFKYTKRKYGEGRRIFKMSPLHHHFQKLGYHEAKIVSRFWIVGIMLAILSIVTLKLR
ncbi:MAG: phospho-N-acetylmuramoyl-pentapeptide-transferase [Flavobacteriales bacterium]|nr:phospho-N-acetylmuramoyl-pentapeptide-transferase [Flavobacteriales bacterium]